MHIDWSGSGLPIGLSPRIDPSAKGPTVMSFLRRVPASNGQPGYSMFVTAEVDGPVRNALMSVNGPWDQSGGGCWTTDEGLNGGKHLYQMYGNDVNGYPMSTDLGSIGGPIGELQPKVMVHFQKTSPYADGYTCSSNWFARVTWPIVLYAHPWSNPSKPLLVSSAGKDPESLTFSQLVMHEDALFWTTADSYRSGINSWNPVDGARPFIRYVGDATRGAGNLGTDGVDLAWSYGEGKQPGDKVSTYPKRDIMTAPFTSDPAALKPRRLRSDPMAGMAAAPFQVGCGYAAHGRLTAPVVVVRIADGQSWSIPILGSDFHLQETIGVTCDHVYALAEIGGRWNVARIRLDSLGPGVPPD
jgi:hypothetical protein